MMKMTSSDAAPLVHCIQVIRNCCYVPRALNFLAQHGNVLLEKKCWPCGMPMLSSYYGHTANTEILSDDSKF